MKRMWKNFSIGLASLVLLISCGSEKGQVSSPNAKIKVETGIENGKVFYSVKRDHQEIIAKSFLGFVLKDGDFNQNFKIKNEKQSSFDETWKQPWGEDDEVRNNYNELELTLQEEKGKNRELVVRFRVFDDGVGFRYEFPEQDNLKDFTITDEQTEFNFAEDLNSWSLPYTAEFYEGLYTKKPISKVDTISTPITLEKEGLVVSVHEANLTDYASLNLIGGNGSQLKTFLTPLSSGDKVVVNNTRVSPWRTIVIGENAGDLITSRLMLNLNEPSKIKDTSWIKPGRYIGVWWGIHMEKYSWKMGPNHGAATENVLRYIDFAAQHHFDGVLVEGWNVGWEDWATFDFLKSYPDFDIQKITEYAKSKGVKLIGHHETAGNTLKYESQMEEAFKMYQKYGVNVVKTGYVGHFLDGKELHGSQYGVNHYRKVIETAAKYNIMIDNHEPAMPTGLQRTWPNLMTQEGVRGQEWDAWSKDGGNPPSHTTIIPFTRGLAGPMDFTPGTFNFDNLILPNTRVQTTLAKQLALSVVIYSPLQMASDMIENYENQPAFEFITSCPTNWSKTVVPNAVIGEFVTIARKDRDSENWYLGSITNEQARTLEVKLDFLDKNATYKAKIFKDGKDAEYKSNPYPVEIVEQQVTQKDVLKLNLATSGGTAIIFEKI